MNTTKIGTGQVSHRTKLADATKAAVLKSQNLKVTPDLPELCKMMLWAQSRLSEDGANVPTLANLSEGVQLSCSPTMELATLVAQLRKYNASQ